MSTATQTQAFTLEDVFGDEAAVPVTIITCTKPTMLKRNNPYLDRVKKVMTAKGIAGPDYQQARRDAGEPDFVAEKPPWGEVVAPCILRHKGQDYLRFQITHSESTYFVDDAEMDFELLKPFFLAPKEEEAVKYRTIAAKSLRLILRGPHVYHFFEPE